eukprot:TRINITY_DN6865_c0_g1_i1.p1 TRINITY_DN6865_c0_g1~~TRINITY_DN6865_c0_g1_i1.p1  ORF type:complete len:535 (+),score=79.66 TRINITY_DN6865_c0_g1_i1:190-1794(+)
MTDDGTGNPEVGNDRENSDDDDIVVSVDGNEEGSASEVSPLPQELSDDDESLINSGERQRSTRTAPVCMPREKKGLIVLYIVVIALFVAVAFVLFSAAKGTDGSNDTERTLGPPGVVPVVLATWAYCNSTDLAFEELTYLRDYFDQSSQSEESRSTTDRSEQSFPLSDGGVPVTDGSERGSALNAVEIGCNFCENHADLCGHAVGLIGGKPDDRGEVSLDALLMWGPTRNVGAVGGLKRIKNAISVARRVLDDTTHTFLVGDDARLFALENYPSDDVQEDGELVLGFRDEGDASNDDEWTTSKFNEWIANDYKPAFWNVPHDYNLTTRAETRRASKQKTVDETKQRSRRLNHRARRSANSGGHGNAESRWASIDHDTIGMVAVDALGRLSAGTSTNGLTHKIAGRVGDTPVAGAGGYANEHGACVCTGNGDVMMRFLPSFAAVQAMTMDGIDPQTAATQAIDPIPRYYPDASGAIVCVDSAGRYGAAMFGYEDFPFCVRNADMEASQLLCLRREKPGKGEKKGSGKVYVGQCAD